VANLFAFAALAEVSVGTTSAAETVATTATLASFENFTVFSLSLKCLKFDYLVVIHVLKNSRDTF
jgi:hypothetical protein